MRESGIEGFRFPGARVYVVAGSWLFGHLVKGASRAETIFLEAPGAIDQGAKGGGAKDSVVRGIGLVQTAVLPQKDRMATATD